MTYFLLVFTNQEPMTVSVDWGSGSGFPYSQADANTRVVGAEVARLINFLHTNKGVSLESFHLIGHSIGAHVAGYADNRVPGLARITGNRLTYCKIPHTCWSHIS